MRRFHIRLAVFVSLALLLCAPAAAQDQDRPEDPGLKLIRPLLVAVYPELHGYITMTFSTLLSPAWNWNNRVGVGFTVCDGDPTKEPCVSTPRNPNPPPNSITDKRPRVLLKGSVGLDMHGWLMSLQTSESDMLNSKKHQEIMDLCEKHPDSAKAVVTQALKAAGATYGPADQEAFLKTLPLRQLEPFLGKLTVKSVELSYLSDRIVGCLDAYWLVIVQANPGPPRRGKEFFLTFDPFSGHLTGISTRDEY